MAESLEHQRLLRQMAAAIDRVCSQNTDLRGVTPTMFDAVSVPAMSVHAYLVRMRRYTKFDFSCFLVAITYLDRLCRQGLSFCPTMHNIHRLVVTALLVASKATDDIFHANMFMAQCGGISVSELNKLELELCRQLDWRLVPTVQQLHTLRASLDDLGLGYWDAWRNTNATSAHADAATGETDEHGMCKTPAPDGAKGRLPQSKSLQDHLGRILFGTGCGESERPPPEKGSPQISDSKPLGGDSSPVSPRSVFRRIFSEQVFSFAS